VPGIRTHRATFSNGAENEIFTERRIIKAEACERADRWLLANRTLLARPSPCHSGYARANRWSSWADIDWVR
jgi:hypothetical protein